MGRRRTFDEDAVIEAAIAVFSEHGYAGTDVSLVCEHAGIGRSSFYHTFTSLDEVFLRALRTYTAQGAPERERLLASEDSAPVLLMERLGGELAHQCEDVKRVGCLSANTAAELGRALEPVNGILDANRSVWVQTYAELLRRGIAAGHIRPTIVPEVHGPLIQSVLAGLRITARISTPAEVQAQTRAFVASLCTETGAAALETSTPERAARTPRGHLGGTQ